MAKPKQIDLPDGARIPILYEDRAVLAIDKPAGWLLAPDSWDRTSRNLQLALMSSIRGGDYWARSRNLQFLRFAHRRSRPTVACSNHGVWRRLTWVWCGEFPGGRNGFAD